MTQKNLATDGVTKGEIMNKTIDDKTKVTFLAMLLVWWLTYAAPALAAGW